MHRCIALIAFALLAMHGATAMAKAPSWVTPFDGALSKAPEGATGTHWHLWDRQTRHTGDSIETYYRQAFSMHGAEAVQHVERVWFADAMTSVDYVRVLRDGKRIDVPPTIVMTTDEEGDTYRTVELPELVSGDVIDYAWVERQPGDRDAITGVIQLGAMSHHDAQRLRLLVPSTAEVTVTVEGEHAPARRDAVGAFLEYTWQDEGAQERTFAAHTPMWHFQSPQVHYSNVDWPTLARLYATRFNVDAAPSSAVTELAARLATLEQTELERAMAVAQHVQQSIEYRWGPLLHTPRPLDEVIEAGDGTAVERAILLAALARALGLDASVTLAHSGYGKQVQNRLPGPDVLDTALTGVRIDGHVVWIDPTARDYPSQGFITPPVEAALPLSDSSTGFVEVPTQVPFDPDIEVVESYELDGQGANLTITTRIRRGDAEHMRRRLGWSETEVSDGFIEQAQHFAGGVEVVAPVEFTDDTVANEIVVRERYRIGTYWLNGRREVHPYEVVSGMTIPEATRPRLPLAIPHPRFIRHTIEVAPLPPEFEVGDERQSVDTDAFVVDFWQEMRGRKASVTWEYRSRAPFVAANRLDDYQRGLDTPIYGFELWWIAQTPGDPYWHRFLMLLGGFVLAGGTLQTLERRRVLRRATARVMKAS